VLSDVGNERHGVLFVLVQHLGVYLRRRQEPVPEQFRYGIDVCAQVEHQHGKRVPAAMESK
jgi:hypothetical protein